MELRIEYIGEKIGYLVMYLLFTTILYFILKLLNKFPDDWNYFYIMGLIFIIVLIGVLIKKVLE